MKIKRNTPIKKLYRLLNAGLISRAHIDSLINSAKPIGLKFHLMWTLDEYSELLECSTDIEIIQKLYEIEKKSSTWLKAKLLFVNLRAEKYFRIIAHARKGLEDISSALSMIEQPPMSNKQISAGFGNLSFGDMGIARTVGSFENIGTMEAYKLPMHMAIKSLSQLSQTKICEYKFNINIRNGNEL